MKTWCYPSKYNQKERNRFKDPKQRIGYKKFNTEIYTGDKKKKAEKPNKRQ